MSQIRQALTDMVADAYAPVIDPLVALDPIQHVALGALVGALFVMATRSPPEHDISSGEMATTDVFPADARALESTTPALPPAPSDE